MKYCLYSMLLLSGSFLYGSAEMETGNPEHSKAELKKECTSMKKDLKKKASTLKAEKNPKDQDKLAHDIKALQGNIDEICKK